MTRDILDVGRYRRLDLRAAEEFARALEDHRERGPMSPAQFKQWWDTLSPSVRIIVNGLEPIIRNIRAGEATVESEPSCASKNRHNGATAANDRFLRQRAQILQFRPHSWRAFFFFVVGFGSAALIWWLSRSGRL